jgi:hypothetical protein
MSLIFAVGFAYAFGGEVTASFVAVAVLTYFGMIGFVPIYATVISAIIVILIVVGRTQ